MGHYGSLWVIVHHFLGVGDRVSLRGVVGDCG